MNNTCRICNSDKLSFYSKVNKWLLKKCSNCGSVLVQNKPEKEELDIIYLEIYFKNNKYQDTKTLFKEYFYRLNKVEKYLPKKSVLLDYGCANGDFMHFACTNFFFYGIDYSDDAIKLAQGLYPEIKNNFFFYSHFQKINDKSLDGIVMWDVIEHLWEPVDVIKNLILKLKSGAYLFISTPKINSLFAKITKKYWPFMTPPEHLSFISEKAFYIIAKELNCEVCEISSKGKWVNIGFLLYKVKRIFPMLINTGIINLFKSKYLSKWAIYIPSNDIQYIVIKKM